jgi:UDP-glucose 4-epimerase
MVVPENRDLPYSFQQEFGDQFLEKRVLITGATGFVGLNLCQALNEIGAQVMGAALPDSIGPATDREKILPVDLTHEGSARSIIEAVEPDLVFHLAGMVDTRQSLDLVLPTLTHNLLGSVHVMAGLVGSQCQRVIVVASSEAPRLGQSPNSPYAASKQAMVTYAEMYSALFNLPVVIARPHLVYGPHQPPDKLIPYLIRCCLEHNPPLLSSGKRVCDPIYVKDFVRALLHMATSNKALGLTLDVGTGRGLSVAGIAARVLQLMGADMRPVFGTIPDRVSEAPQVADTRLTEATLAWHPAWSLDAGLSETIDWFRAQGNIIASGSRPAPGEVLE